MKETLILHFELIILVLSSTAENSYDFTYKKNGLLLAGFQVTHSVCYMESIGRNNITGELRVYTLPMTRQDPFGNARAW